jgi:hypothetical protein
MRMFKKASSFEEMEFIKSKKEVLSYLNSIYIRLQEREDSLIEKNIPRNKYGIAFINLTPFYKKENYENLLVVESEIKFKETPKSIENLKRFLDILSREKEFVFYNDTRLSDADFYKAYYLEMDEETYIKRTNDLYITLVKIMEDLINFIKGLEFKDTALYTGESDEYELYKKDMIQEMAQLGFNTEIISPIQKATFTFIKNSFINALTFIKLSPLKKFFKYCQNVDIVIGTEDEIKRDSSKNVLAFYRKTEDKIYVYIDRIERIGRIEETLVEFLIHELAHRFHYLGLVDGFRNESIDALYLDSQYLTECFLSSLPKIGDSIRDINFKPSSSLFGDVLWKQRKDVKDLYKDYILTRITKDEYTYTNKDIAFVLDKKDILKFIRCPSEYGTKDEKEFFAEMCTLVTLGEQAPSQKIMVEKFIKIVNNESE